MACSANGVLVTQPVQTFWRQRQRRHRSFPTPTPGRCPQLVQNGTLKTYQGFPHGMPTTQDETINADLLGFIQS